ncbi:hypothetical protein [Lactobacillus helveticus]|nr:hypothetical protein [Lactobacillus helveticus]
MPSPSLTKRSTCKLKTPHMSKTKPAIRPVASKQMLFQAGASAGG